jgi:hypothetical protein
MTYSCPHCGALAEDTGADDACLDTGTTLTCNACRKPAIVALMTPGQYRAWVDARPLPELPARKSRCGRPHVTVGAGVQVPGTGGNT